MNIVQVLDHPHVFGPVIEDHATWGAWALRRSRQWRDKPRLKPD